ncbi:MAG: acetyl-CoA carboxylase biotin carboxyl carrier protein [Candidatus Gastranaerophilaceae bacterium]
MIDKKHIQELADLLNKNGLTELSLKEGDKEIVLKKEKGIVSGAAPSIVSASTLQGAGTSEAFVCTPVEVKKGKPITSPMVGTFYKSPSPDSKPFVEIGSAISDGDVVCIIEAMKLMNEIESDVSGKVAEICVEDGQPVEFGQVLMYVE